MTKRFQLGLLLLLLVFLSSLLGWRFWQRSVALKWQVETIESVNISFDKPADLVVDELTDKDRESRILYRAQAPASSSQPYLFSIRTEDGLKMPSSLTKQELVPMILGNSEKAFPGRFPKYAQKSTRQFEVDGHKAGEIIFNYKNPAGSITQQRFIIIDKDGNTAIYLAFQAKESDFEQLNQDIFSRITSTLTLR